MPRGALPQDDLATHPHAAHAPGAPSSAMSTTSAPIPAIGRRTVVRAGTTSQRADVVEPATPMSSGTRSPASRRAANAPSAITSVTAKRQSTGGAPSRRRAGPPWRRGAVVGELAGDDVLGGRLGAEVGEAVAEALGAVPRGGVVRRPGQHRSAVPRVAQGARQRRAPSRFSTTTVLTPARLA
jgi:hypothetical protein